MVFAVETCSVEKPSFVLKESFALKFYFTA